MSDPHAELWRDPEWEAERDAVVGEILAEIGPDPGALAAAQTARALQWLADVRAGKGMRWFLPTLHGLTGRLLPGWTCFLGGYSKTAKTTLLMHQALYLARHGVRVGYVGTETASEILKLQAAALLLGWPVEDVVTGARHWRYQGDEYEQPMTPAELAEVERALGEVERLGDCLMFADTDGATLGDARYWMRWAAKHGAAVAIVDHIHQLDTGTADRYTALEAAVRTLGQDVKSANIVGLIAAQFRESTHDVLANHEVPGDGQWFGTKAFNQVGAVNLQLWRPFKAGLTDEARRAVKSGEADLSTVLRPGTIGVRCSAHRIRGGRAIGDLRMLRIEGDTITDQEAR